MNAATDNEYISRTESSFSDEMCAGRKSKNLESGGQERRNRAWETRVIGREMTNVGASKAEASEFQIEERDSLDSR